MLNAAHRGDDGLQSAPLRRHEAAALAALKMLQVLDSEAEPEFDALLVQAVSAVCQAPVSLITLIDAERQWFKSSVGFPGVSETPRELAFCAHAALGEDILEVPDATLDTRCADNPLVLGEPGIVFYAGAPLQDRQGHRLGTLCVIDRQPRQLSAARREALVCLARAVMAALERRRQVHEARVATPAIAQAALVEHYRPDAIVGFDMDGSVVRWNMAAERLFGQTAQAVIGRLARELMSPSATATARMFGDAIARDLQVPQTFAQEFLDFMVNGGQRARALIRDLLSLARIDSQARPWEPVALEALLADARQMRQTRQLFTHLVGNALKLRDGAAPQVPVAAERAGTVR